MWGGATFDVALRFLHEDPWERLARLRERCRTCACRCSCAGAICSATTPYSEAAVVRAFVAEAVATGIDVIRIFDALNNVERMRAAIEAAIEAGAVVEGAMCYTGDLSDPAERVYTLDYYLRARRSDSCEAGVHVLAIKDMAGLLRAPAARTLVTSAAGGASTCPCICTPTTRRAARSRPISRRSTPGSTRSTVLRRRWRA